MKARDLRPGALYRFKDQWGCSLTQGYSGTCWLTAVPDFMSDPYPSPILLYIGHETFIIPSTRGGGYPLEAEPTKKRYHCFLLDSKTVLAKSETIKHLLDVPENKQNDL